MILPNICNKAQNITICNFSTVLNFIAETTGFENSEFDNVYNYIMGSGSSEKYKTQIKNFQKHIEDNYKELKILDEIYAL